MLQGQCHSSDINESTSDSFVAQLVTNRTGVSFSRLGPHNSNVANFPNSSIFLLGNMKNCWFVGESTNVV